MTSFNVHHFIVKAVFTLMCSDDLKDFQYLGNYYEATTSTKGFLFTALVAALLNTRVQPLTQVSDRPACSRSLSMLETDRLLGGGEYAIIVSRTSSRLTAERCQRRSTPHGWFQSAVCNHEHTSTNAPAHGRHWYFYYWLFFFRERMFTTERQPR